MRLKIFDVVELNNGNKATILERIDKSTYKAEIVNDNGKSQGIISIKENEIMKVIFSK